MALWRQWKTIRRRRAALLALGVRPKLASNTAGSSRGPWYLAHAKALSVALPTAYFKSLGLPNLEDARSVSNSNRRVRTRTHGGVAGVSGQPLPLCRSDAVTGQVTAVCSTGMPRVLQTQGGIVQDALCICMILPQLNRPRQYSVAPVWHTCCLLAILAVLSGSVGIPKSGFAQSRARAPSSLYDRHTLRMGRIGVLPVADRSSFCELCVSRGSRSSCAAAEPSSLQ